MRLYLDVQPTVRNAPVFHYEDDSKQSKARVDFCIRFSLYQEDAIEVNFQETQVTFYADLTDGFNVNDVFIQPKDKNEENVAIDCEIIAYECDRSTNQPIPNQGFLRNQGREVRTCVELSKESKAKGLLLDRITWFYWTLQHEESGQTVRQNAINFDSQAAPNGLTEYECLRGVDVCPFNTILEARFFQWADGK
jgi:hypothetical protein